MRNPRLVLVLALVLVVVVIGLAWLTVVSSPEPGPAPSPSPSPSATTSALPSAATRSPQATPTAPATPTPPPATSPPDPPSAAGDDDGAAAAPTTPTSGPGDAAAGDEEAERLTLRLSAEELSSAATQGLPPEAPVEAIDLAPRSAPGGAAVLDVRADVPGLPVELTGEIAVEVAAGRLAPRLVDAELGPFGLSEAVRATIDDVLAELGDDLVDPGWQIEDVRVVDEELVVDARRTSTGG